MNNITKEETRLLAFELTQLLSQDDPNAAARMVGEARIDPNPHQIEAALFGYRALQNGGAILGDEVGLGKTIEAGLILNQYWAEGKRRILIVPPVSLRGQWREELSRLFYLESQIINSGEWKALTKSNKNPVLRGDPGIYILGEHLINSNKEAFKSLHFDLVVIDEAHRMRNVYKKKKTDALIAKGIREIFISTPKLLLTATPFQNNLNELYGLVSLIDSSYFGSFESFQRLYSKGQNSDIGTLRDRIKPIFNRTLRKEVSHYLKYTERKSTTIRHNYDSASEEKAIHSDLVELLKSDYLLLNDKNSRGFVNLIYLKLLGSSPYALNPALLKMIGRFFQGLVKRGASKQTFNIWMGFTYGCFSEYNSWESHWKKMAEFCSGNTQLSFEGVEKHLEKISKSKKNIDIEDDDIEDEEDSSKTMDLGALENPAHLKKQINMVLSNYFKTHKPFMTGRAESFIKTLNKHISESKEKGFSQKAVVFTEYKRTMRYVSDLIRSSDLRKYKIIPFHGGLSSKKDQNGISERDKAIEEFRNSDQAILVCTEAGAEGLNLQFCNLVINYDLPWNPQRLEQRIGRCHRYGQKNDVVVINFVCDENSAEQHIFKILSEKFTLFDGVFGASNSVLGVLESGKNIESLFSDLYLGVRSEQEVANELDAFMEVSEKTRKAGVQEVAAKLLTEFDPEVTKFLKVDWDSLKESVALQLTKIEKKLSKFVLSQISGSECLSDKAILQFNNGESYPVLRHRPHTFQRVYASDDLPLLTAKHQEIEPLLLNQKAQQPLLGSSYSLDLDQRSLDQFGVKKGESVIFGAFLWKISGMVAYEKIELCLMLKNGDIKSGDHLRDLFQAISGSKRNKDNSQEEKKLLSYFESISESLNKEKEERSNQIYSEKILIKINAIDDQRKAEGRLMVERNDQSNKFDMELLKAPMKAKAAILKKKEAALKKLDKEVEIYREAIKIIEKQKAELSNLLIKSDSKGSIVRECIFLCEINT